MICKCKNYLTSIGKPKNKIDCIAWLLLNVFGCKFCETCRDKSCNIKDGELCTDNIANYIREAVKEETPTADVVEVRHAEWELIEKEDFIYEIRKCSACGAERFFEEDDKLCNFCPDCGAKMDGERREKNEG
jgi:hypothetical protein